MNRRDLLGYFVTAASSVATATYAQTSHGHGNQHGGHSGSGSRAGTGSQPCQGQCGSGSSPSPIAADGSANAPVKAAGPQHPTWLKDEPHRPSWYVAGVDYPVGINDSALPLKPARSVPAPSIYDPAGGPRRGLASVTINGNNVHLDGFDFTDCVIIGDDVNGKPISGMLITNCKFGYSTYSSSTSDSPIIGGNSGTIRYCEIDCVNVNVTVMPGACLSYEPYAISSPVTVEYCWIINARGILFSLIDGASQTFRFNLLENVGLYDTDGVQHPNFFQWNGGATIPCSALIAYNFMVQNNCAAGSNTNGRDNGLGFVCANATFGAFVADHNTLRISPDVPPQYAGFMPDGESMQLNEWASGPQVNATIAPGGAITITNNYCDNRGTMAFSSSRSGASYKGNIEMQTGASLDVSG
jgi:hypothetical protein